MVDRTLENEFFRIIWESLRPLRRHKTVHDMRKFVQYQTQDMQLIVEGEGVPHSL
jgi:hypothetical protein